MQLSADTFTHGKIPYSPKLLLTVTLWGSLKIDVLKQGSFFTPVYKNECVYASAL